MLYYQANADHQQILTFLKNIGSNFILKDNKFKVSQPLEDDPVITFLAGLGAVVLLFQIVL